MPKKRKSHYHADMLSVEEAREKILSVFKPLEEINVNIKDSLGYVISKDIVSKISVPPWDNSAMDGYAVLLEDVKNASVVITNPTHFAVAIKYDPIENEAPLILAMGKDLMAKRVIEQAELNSIALVRSPLLARALYYTGGIGQNISEQLYSAVASILAYVYQIDKGVNVEFNEPEIPADFVFDEFGKRVEE